MCTYGAIMCRAQSFQAYQKADVCSLYLIDPHVLMVCRKAELQEELERLNKRLATAEAVSPKANDSTVLGWSLEKPPADISGLSPNSTVRLDSASYTGQSHSTGVSPGSASSVSNPPKLDDLAFEASQIDECISLFVVLLTHRKV